MLKWILITCALWLLCMVLYKKANKSFNFTIGILPLLCVWILITIDLGVNYLGAAIPSLNDGIGLHGAISYLLIGDENWSVQRFKELYTSAFLFTLCLTAFLSLSILFDNLLKHRKGGTQP